MIVQPGLAFSRHRPLGTIAGLVRDDQGRPIGGALVKLMDSTVAGAMARSILTDQRGNFYARNIIPGTYRLRAEATGYVSAVKPVEVKSDVVLSLKFELKRIGTLADQRPDRDDYRWTVRSLPRPVLRLKGEDEQPAEVAAADNEVLSKARPVHGMIQVVSGLPFNSLTPASSYVGMNVALAGHAAENLELIFLGQVSAYAGFPSRLQLIASTFPSDTHQLTAKIGYARLQAIGESPGLRDIDQLSLAVVDSWRVAGPVMVIYGFDLTHFSGRENQWVASPRLGMCLAADKKTRVSADYMPVSAQEAHKQADFSYEGGQAIIASPQDLLIAGDGTKPDQSRRLQLAVDRQLDDDSSIEAALFYDEFSGRGVGLLAVPINADRDLKDTWHSITQQGQARGARITIKRDLTSFLSGMVGYSIGRGQKLAPGSGIDPAGLFQDAAFHVLSLRLDANLSRTHTHISSTYRLGSQGALFAIDPFYGRLDVFEPSLNIVLTQEIPDLGILPGHWEASVDARNLFDQPDGISTDGRSVLLSQTCRSIRGSVSVRF
jgi:hypothetical protein